MICFFKGEKVYGYCLLLLLLLLLFFFFFFFPLLFSSFLLSRSTGNTNTHTVTHTRARAGKDCSIPLCSFRDPSLRYYILQYHGVVVSMGNTQWVSATTYVLGSVQGIYAKRATLCSNEKDLLL